MHRSRLALLLTMYLPLAAMQLEVLEPKSPKKSTGILDPLILPEDQVVTDEVGRLLEQIESSDLPTAIKAYEQLGNALFSGTLGVDRNAECARAILAIGNAKQRKYRDRAKTKNKRSSSHTKTGVRPTNAAVINPLIIDAASHEALPLVQWLVVKQNKSINARNRAGETALSVALTKGNYCMIDWLLEQNADPRAVTGEILLNCVTKGQFALIRKLRQYGLDIFDMKSEHSFLSNLFFFTEEAGRVPALSALFDTHLTQEQQGIIFCLAVIYRSESVINYCLDSGIDVPSARLNGISPLILAVRSLKMKDAQGVSHNGTEDISVRETRVLKNIEFLLSKGVDVNDGGEKCASPLHEAVDIDNVRIVELLLERGADVRRGGSYTPPVVACAKSKNGALRLFLERTPHACRYLLRAEKKELSCFPFFYVAAAGENYEGMELLRTYGADINAPVFPDKELADDETVYCMPSLYFAALQGDRTLSQLLLMFGADPQLTAASAYCVTNKGRSNLGVETIKSMQDFIDSIK